MASPVLAPMDIRPATQDDRSALAAIYGHHVSFGTATFETVPPTAEEMAQRVGEVQARGCPWLVAARGDRILGYAYARPYHQRAAYAHTVEDSVYVAPDGQRQGVGRALLTQVIIRCEALGFRQMMAAIGDSENLASIALHRAMGFRLVGRAEAIGFKHGAWRDVVYMQRSLGPGSGTPP